VLVIWGSKGEKFGSQLENQKVETSKISIFYKPILNIKIMIKMY
jgi:hypothetical protein